MSGYTLVELMIGLTVGLLVLAATSAAVVTTLRDTRRALLETRLAQDLRGALALVARDLRRAGHWPHPVDGAPNPYAAVHAAADENGAATLAYRVAGDADGDVGVHEEYGFRLRAGVLESRLGAGGWQALTDPVTLVVARFEIEAAPEDRIALRACPASCADGLADAPGAGPSGPAESPAATTASTACSVHLLTRRYRLRLAGSPASDPGLGRELTAVVRLRNDLIVDPCGPDAAMPPPTS